MENVKRQVRNILEQIKREMEANLNSSSLVTEGLLDSLDIMNLIMELENEFEIEIDPEDVLSENFESVDAIAALVEKCRS